jgi:mono/diheme cytochrome c family protein
MKTIIGIAGLFATATVSAQQPVWSPDIANIVYTHCSSCHHAGGIAPFALTSYSEVTEHAWAMAEQVAQRHMPPWPADPAYRHFKDENVLTQAEIDALAAWVVQGQPFGNPDLEPVAPEFPETGSMLDTIDHVVAIEPYTLQYNTDEYRWFAIPTDFPDTVYVNAIEVFPGLDSIVHHADISFDVTGGSADLDDQDPLPGFNSNTGSPVYSYYMNAWQPGGNIARYPSGWGIAVPPGADFVLEIHYGPGGIGLTDSTRMNLRFVTNTADVRPVHVGWTLYDTAPCLVDGPLVIPANTMRTFHQEREMTQTRSYISICPHMHHLGKSYKVWFEDDGEVTGLIDIPHWTFHWQKYYTFQQVQVIPAGATIKSEGVYDNTPFNEDNPSDPPVTVQRGATTMDEMFLTYFIWTDYRQGDEDIVLDSTMFVGLDDVRPPEEDWSVWPTLANDQVFLNTPIRVVGTLDVSILDAAGRRVKSFRRLSATPTISMEVGDLPAGVYCLRVEGSGAAGTRRFIKR